MKLGAATGRVQPFRRHEARSRRGGGRAGGRRAPRCGFLHFLGPPLLAALFAFSISPRAKGETKMKWLNLAYAACVACAHKQGICNATKSPSSGSVTIMGSAPLRAS